MSYKRKFSLFISSTYEDLKEERQALIGVALENNFIPVGMEQFHAAPASQWDVITRMINECDFYLLVIGGRYGSIDESTDKSYTEKEYDYAKSIGIPVLVLIKKTDSITADKQDINDDKYDKYEKMRRLEGFRNKVKNDGNTVDFFTDINDLKYVASPTLRTATEYASATAGWVRYREVVEVINQEVESRNIMSAEFGMQQKKTLEDMQAMLSEFGTKLEGIEKNKLAWEELPIATNSDVEKLFHVEDEDSHIGIRKPVVGQHDAGTVPIEPAFLLVYAAEGDGQIMRIQPLGSPVLIFANGKQFMADNSPRESARWQEALDRLISWKWVKPVGYKGEVYELTGTGYDEAEMLKKGMGINTDKEPLDELKEFGY